MERTDESGSGKLTLNLREFLFYLDLESINKTVIDMQVQNRIVSVTVFNADDTLKTIGVPPFSAKFERRTRISRL